MKHIALPLLWKRYHTNTCQINESSEYLYKNTFYSPVFLRYSACKFSIKLPAISRVKSNFIRFLYTYAYMTFPKDHI